MKYIIILLIVLSSCSLRDEMIVKSVTKKNLDGFPKYSVEVICTANNTEHVFITDSLYTVGDTLVIRRKWKRLESFSLYVEPSD